MFSLSLAGATEAAILKKPSGKLTDNTSEKEIEAEAFKKSSGKLSADTSEFEHFMKPLLPGSLTGKKEGSKNSCDADFPYPNKESFKNLLQYGRLTDETGSPDTKILFMMLDS